MTEGDPQVTPEHKIATYLAWEVMLTTFRVANDLGNKIGVTVSLPLSAIVTLMNKLESQADTKGVNSESRH
jgi:hypothetical protein